MESTPTPIRILLVEDNPGDVDLLRLSLREAGLPVEVTVISTGVEAVDFVRELEAQDSHPKPDLVLLDINLPGADGKQILKLVRANERLRDLPVVIVSGSENPRDVTDTAALGSTAYIRKASELKSFLHIGQEIREIWESLSTGSARPEARSPSPSRPQGV